MPPAPRRAAALSLSSHGSYEKAGGWVGILADPSLFDESNRSCNELDREYDRKLPVRAPFYKETRDILDLGVLCAMPRIYLCALEIVRGNKKNLCRRVNFIVSFVCSNCFRSNLSPASLFLSVSLSLVDLFRIIPSDRFLEQPAGIRLVRNSGVILFPVSSRFHSRGGFSPSFLPFSPSCSPYLSSSLSLFVCLSARSLAGAACCEIEKFSRVLRTSRRVTRCARRLAGLPARL